jgi:hypothetical protein
MKKLTSVLIAFLIAAYFIAAFNVSATLLFDDGLTYNYEIDYTNTVSSPSCSSPNLYAGQNLMGKYIGYTREFVLGGEFGSFTIGDYYYKNVGSIHRIYEIYDYCYIETYDLVSVDLNGDSFYNEEYVGVLWEYDFSDLVDNPAFKAFAGTTDDGRFENMLMIGSPKDTGWMDYYYIYKSLIIKYNPKLYTELTLLFAGYYSIAEDVRDFSNEQAGEYLQNAISSTIDVSLDVSNVKAKDAIEIALNFANNHLFDGGGEATKEAFFDTLKSALNAQRCEPLESIYGEVAKDVCEIFVENGIDASYATYEEFINSFDDIMLGEIISDYAYGVAGKLVKYAAKKALGGVTLSIAETAYNLFVASLYYSSAQSYDRLMNDIKLFVDLFSIEDYAKGRNLRIDFIFDYDQEFVYDPTDSVEDFEWWWYESMKYKQDGLVISFNESDVINSVVGKDFMMIDFDELSNYSELGEDIYLAENREQCIIDEKLYVFTDVKGKLTLLSYDGVVDVLNDYIHMQHSIGNAPRFDHYEVVDYIFITPRMHPTYEVQYTVDRNKYFTVDTFANTTLTEISSIVTTSSSAKINIVFSANIDSYVSTEIRVYRNGLFVQSYSTSNLIYFKTFFSLLPNTTYKTEIWTTFNSPFDGGTIQVKTDERTFRTLVTTTGTIPKPILME